MSDYDSNLEQDTDTREALRDGQVKKLKERIDELLKDNVTLQAQFEEAVKFSEQVEDLHKQNTNLLSQLRDVKAEKDDLLHRLDILAQKDRETNERLNREKSTSSNQRGADLTSMNKEIEKIKQQSKAQIDSIYEQLEQAEQARENPEAIQAMASYA